MNDRTPIRPLIPVLGLTATLLVGQASWASDYLQDAKNYLAEGEVRAAEIQLKNAVREEPANVEARRLLAAISLARRDGAAAEKEFARMRDLGAPSAEWAPGYARALLLQGESERLLDEVPLDESLEAAQEADIVALRGHAHLALGDTDAAAAAFDQALALDPENAMAGVGGARAKAAAGNVEGALSQLDNVLVAHPDSVEARLLRAELKRRERDFEAAMADYRAVIEVLPNSVPASTGLALAQLANRDMDGARETVKHLGQIAPGVPMVSYLKAVVAFQERDLDRAAESLQLVLRSAPGNLQAQLLYGVVSYGRNEFTIADDYLTRVQANMPGNPMVAKVLGATRLRLNQPQRAVEVLEAEVDESTDDAQLLALLGTAYLQSGDNTRGAELLQRAVEADPDQASLRAQLAVGKIAAGDTTGGIAELESAVALGQDLVQAEVLLVLGYLNKREFDKALEAATELETRMADNPLPYNLSGLVYLAQRDFETAGQRFNKALELDPNFLVARMNLARLARAAGRPDEAVQAYRGVLEIDSKHLGALMGLSGMAGERGDREAAQEWLERANREHPSALQPMLALAEVYLRAGEPLKALRVLSSATGEQADLPAVLRLRGMTQLQNGDYASAVATLRRLTARQPNGIEGWFQLARAYAANNDAERSRESFERAIALDGDHQVPLVWLGLAELELRERRFDAAASLAEQIQTYFPDQLTAYDIASAAHRGRGDLEQALAADRAALAKGRTSARINRYAAGLMASGDGDAAVGVLEQWLAEQPEDPAAWANLGMSQQRLGNEPEAIEAYERVIALQEPGAVLLNNLAWMYLERNPARALDLATRAYETAPSSPEIVDTYGWALVKSGRPREGLSALQQALVIAPDNAEIALHVAQVMVQLNRHGEARPLLERIVREQPDSTFARTARELLAKLSG
jgi:putative PEP-CTERM system TPR-repeat lipoprotein